MAEPPGDRFSELQCMVMVCTDVVVFLLTPVIQENILTDVFDLVVLDICLERMLCILHLDALSMLCSRYYSVV